MTLSEHPETQELISHLFSGQSKKWGEYAWFALASAGKVPTDLYDPDEDDYVDHIITMAALSTLAEWFDYDYDLSDFEASCDILMPKVQLSEFALGRYVERNGIDPYDSDGFPSASRAANEAVLERTREVARELKDAIGESMLFTSLWSIVYDDSISLPPSREDVDQVLNGDISSELGYRFDRLQNL